MFNLLLLLVSQTNDVLKVPDGIEADVKHGKQPSPPSIQSVPHREECRESFEAQCSGHLHA